MRSRHDKHDRDFAEVKAAIKVLYDLIKKGFKAMADRSKELEAAFEELSTEFVRLATDIDNQLKVIADPGTPEAAVNAAIAKAQALVAGMKEKAAALEADDPPTA